MELLLLKLLFYIFIYCELIIISLSDSIQSTFPPFARQLNHWQLIIAQLQQRLHRSVEEQQRLQSDELENEITNLREQLTAAELRREEYEERVAGVLESIQGARELNNNLKSKFLRLWVVSAPLYVASSGEEPELFTPIGFSSHWSFASKIAPRAYLTG